MAVNAWPQPPVLLAREDGNERKGCQRPTRHVCDFDGLGLKLVAQSRHQVLLIYLFGRHGGGGVWVDDEDAVRERGRKREDRTGVEGCPMSREYAENCAVCCVWIIRLIRCSRENWEGALSACEISLWGRACLFDCAEFASLRNDAALSFFGRKSD